MKLIPLTQGPMSSQWNFRGERNGFKFWSSRNGKLFAQGPDGKWYRVGKE